MDKIKVWLRSMPLKRALVSLVLAMTIFVVCVSTATIILCAAVQERVLASVTYVEKVKAESDDETYDIIITDEGKLIPNENGEVVLLSHEYRLENMTNRQRVLYYGSKAAMVLIPAILFVAGTIFCAWLFYSVKLNQPLTLLLQSADRISQNELDFVLDYPAQDEMGELCHAMDVMRAALLESQQETWEMMEDRRKTSASIAHDLRTPITVMKGYTEYLSRNVPMGRISEDKLLETIRRLSQAADRLEAYVNQVRDAQALDAVPIRSEACFLRNFFETQEGEYGLLAKEKNLHFSIDLTKLPNIQVMLDAALVHRLIDNAVSNALRFAKQKITMKIDWMDDILSICVSDDGPGFSDEALQSAAKPFYKDNAENDHFGLGLSICDTLCRKLGGELALSNQTGDQTDTRHCAPSVKPSGACIVMTVKAPVIL